MVYAPPDWQTGQLCVPLLRLNLLQLELIEQAVKKDFDKGQSSSARIAMLVASANKDAAAGNASAGKGTKLSEKGGPVRTIPRILCVLSASTWRDAG